MNSVQTKAKSPVLAALAVVMSTGFSIAAETSTDTNSDKLMQQYTTAEHLLDGKLQYEWISGPRKGNHAENIPYPSRRIGDDAFLVNWHQPDKPDFVSLVIDLGPKRLYSSSILRYGSGNEMIHFKEAVIKQIKSVE